MKGQAYHHFFKPHFATMKVVLYIYFLRNDIKCCPLVIKNLNFLEKIQNFNEFLNKK